MEDIRLKILTPDKVFKDTSGHRVVLPAYEGMLTIIKDRAPTSVLLKEGQVQILDKSGSVIESIAISGGIADIAENVCSIMTEEIKPQ